MTDLTRDVNDALRADKMQELWKEYGPALLVGAVTLVLGTAFFSGWNAWTLSQNQKATTQLIAALESANPAQALSEKIPELKGQTKALGLMNAAGLALQEKDAPKAIGFFDEIIKDRTAPDLVRDLARVQKASVMFDQKDTTAVMIRDVLQPILKEKNGAALPSAKFLNGAAQIMLKEGNKDEGKKMLEEILSDPTLPASLKERAAAIMAVSEVAS